MEIFSIVNSLWMTQDTGIAWSQINGNGEQ
jgi:hypothetical protein